MVHSPSLIPMYIRQVSIAASMEALAAITAPDVLWLNEVAIYNSTFAKRLHSRVIIVRANSLEFSAVK